ncbi:VC0807 family protein [Actinoplanes sp. NPDC051470]|uniref:VC0807 family protein n=1 Tax=unclassified Actinoplanes TaxID=2626549 RepID=UPI00341AA419
MTHGIRDLIRSLAWDLGLPVVTYYALHALGAGDTTALLAGTLAAGARLAWVAVRARALSPFSALMAAVFGVGLLFTFLTGDPRWMLVKHSAMAAIIGLVFVGTALWGRPLTLAAQQSMRPGQAAELTEAYESNPRVRHGYRVTSLVWGGGLLAEAVVRVALVYTLPISVMVGISTLLTVVTFGALFAWTARYVATSRKKAEMALAA